MLQVKKSLPSNSFAASVMIAAVWCVQTVIKTQCMSCGKVYKRGFKLNKKKQVLSILEKLAEPLPLLQKALYVIKFKDLLKRKAYQEVESLYLQAQRLPPGEKLKFKVVHKVQLQVEVQNENVRPSQIQNLLINQSFQNSIPQHQEDQIKAVQVNESLQKNHVQNSSENKSDLSSKYIKPNEDSQSQSSRVPLKNLSNLESKVVIDEKSDQKQSQVQSPSEKSKLKIAKFEDPSDILLSQLESQTKIIEHSKIIKEVKDSKLSNTSRKSTLLQVLANISNQSKNRRTKAKCNASEERLRQTRSLSPVIKQQSKLQLLKPKKDLTNLTKLKRDFENQLKLFGKKRTLKQVQIADESCVVSKNGTKQLVNLSNDQKESSKQKQKEVYKLIRYSK